MFTYKGIRNDEMHLRVLNDVVFESPTRDVNVIQVPGRDGDLIVDNGRFNTVIRSIPCRIEVPNGENVEETIHKISQWLVDDGNFHPFTWDNDPEFTYLARVSGSVVSNRLLKTLGHTTIDFQLHPVKYLKTSLNETQIIESGRIHNPYGVTAKPLIRVIGDGNITIHIGGRPLVLQGIVLGCIIDTETQTITSLSGQLTIFERMRSPFPVLTPGENQITGPRFVQIHVTPRLGALV